jgi:hypothetical protein
MNTDGSASSSSDAGASPRLITKPTKYDHKFYRAR